MYCKHIFKTIANNLLVNSGKRSLNCQITSFVTLWLIRWFYIMRVCCEETTGLKLFKSDLCVSRYTSLKQNITAWKYTPIHYKKPLGRFLEMFCEFNKTLDSDLKRHQKETKETPFLPWKCSIKAILRVKLLKKYHFLLIRSTEYCPSGWEYFQGSCYFFSSTSNSWDDSQTHCQQLSANLVNIGSMEENYFISAEIHTDGWIGLREVPGNKMNWTDDITEPVYVNWPAGEPFYEDGQNHCAYFSLSSGTWHAKNCEDVLHFVCEKGKTFSCTGIPVIDLSCNLLRVVFTSDGVRTVVVALMI